MTEDDKPIRRDRPKCVALLICNEIIEDIRSRSKTLVSLFNTIVMPSLPAHHPRMFILGQFVGSVGTWPVVFRVLDPDLQQIFGVEGQAKITDPLGVLDIVFDVQMLPLQKEGVYFLEVIIDGHPDAERRFNVQLAGNQPL